MSDVVLTSPFLLDLLEGFDSELLADLGTMPRPAGLTLQGRAVYAIADIADYFGCAPEDVPGMVGESALKPMAHVQARMDYRWFH